MRLAYLLGGVALAAATTLAQTRPGGARPNPADWRSTAPGSPVAPGAKLELVGDGYSFTEGCTSDEKGDIYFVDQPYSRILKWTGEGKPTVWLEPSGHANGMSFDEKGNLIACADEKSELWSIAPDKSVTVLLKDYQGKHFNGPNDVWIRPDGGMYLSDPFYKRNYWKERGPAMEQDKQAVYFLSADRKTLTRVIDDMKQPNGVVGTPDGKTLYVADIGSGKTFSYSIRPDGSIADKKLFANLGSDGMTIDSDGNVYTTSGGAVQISNKAGKLIETIPTGGSSNVCFGGVDGNTLFITAINRVYALKMSTHRVGPQ